MKTPPAEATASRPAAAPVAAAAPSTSASAPVAPSAAAPVVDAASSTPRPAPPPIEIAKLAPKTAPPVSKAAVHARDKTTSGNPLAGSAFWNQPQWTRVWDVNHLSLDDERRLRDEFHELIVRFNPLVDDSSPWLSRVEELAEPFMKTLHRKEIKYQFFVLNSDVVNAFSIPGGNVYLSRALFDLIGDDEDYALQFAIGHEMAHVDLEHAVKCLRDPGVMKMREGTLQKLFMLILPFGYLESASVDQEFEADQWAATRMQRIDRTRREILLFLQKLEGYSKAHGFYEGRIKPQPGRDLSPLENHYRAQTAARKRLKNLKTFIDRTAGAPK